jgi:exodeoxyribonuclease-5
MSLKLFSEDQLKALEAISSWYKSKSMDPFKLSGFAGCGKSTLTAYLSTHLDVRVLYMGPTGKSAAVLRSKGVLASTIHSTIYIPVVNTYRRRIDYTLKNDMEDSCDLIVVDEASMVSEDIQRDLESLGPKVIYVGDPFQLPPVGSSTNHMEHANFTLSKLHRFAETNEIYLLSQRVKAGNSVPYGKVGDNLKKVTKGLALLPKTLVEADVVLCGMNSTRKRINDIVRNKKRFKNILEDGERVIITKNNRETGLVNGDMGVITSVGRESKVDYLIEVQYLDDQSDKPRTLTVDTHAFYGVDLAKESHMSDKKFNMAREAHRVVVDYGYALTCHKSQGSEYDNVVLIEEPIGETALDKARWLYTAVTRAKKTLLIGK